MRNRKILSKEDLLLIESTLKDNKIIIDEGDNGLIFEIGQEITTDIAEAVSILMHRIDFNDTIWEIEIYKTYNIKYKISSEKSLYWLSGGNNEWLRMTSYNKPWCDCVNIFKNEFEECIIDIVTNSKTLKDIRTQFIEHLNLPILYDFALSKNLIK